MRYDLIFWMNKRSHAETKPLDMIVAPSNAHFIGSAFNRVKLVGPFEARAATLAERVLLSSSKRPSAERLNSLAV